VKRLKPHDPEKEEREREEREMEERERERDTYRHMYIHTEI
jgi:hypothetical protein